TSRGISRRATWSRPRSRTSACWSMRWWTSLPDPGFRMLRLVLFALAQALAAQFAFAANAQSPLRPEVENFIGEMHERHGFSASRLRGLFGSVRPQPRIIEVMSAPATARPWFEFAPIYLNDKRIQGGVKFWRDNAALLKRATAEYGVPEEIIVATL